METIEKTKKVNLAKFKEDIRELAEGQRELRNQRKTVNIVGERKMEPWQATVDHHNNRAKLRSMYAAYAILRGQDPKEIDSMNFETSWDEAHFKTSVEKLLIMYKEKEDKE